MSYEEWQEWRRRYFLKKESLGHSNPLSDWENEGGSNLINLPTGVYEGGHY